MVLEYEGEGGGPWLVDLSHLQKWDCQDMELDSTAPFGLSMPAEPGQVVFQDGKIITRMNRTQAMITCLRTGDSIESVERALGIHRRNGCVLHAGRSGARNILCDGTCEQSGHFSSRAGTDAVPDARADNAHSCSSRDSGPVDCVLMSFSRGYGQSFSDAILHAASGCDLRPGGENVFNKRFLQKH